MVMRMDGKNDPSDQRCGLTESVKGAETFSHAIERHLADKRTSGMTSSRLRESTVLGLRFISRSKIQYSAVSAILPRGMQWQPK